MLQEIAKIQFCDCTSRREQFMYLSNHKNTKTLHTFNISPQQKFDNKYKRLTNNCYTQHT